VQNLEFQRELDLIREVTTLENDIITKVYGWQLEMFLIGEFEIDVLYSKQLTSPLTNYAFNVPHSLFQSKVFLEASDIWFENLQRKPAFSINNRDLNYAEIVSNLANNGYLPQPETAQSYLVWESLGLKQDKVLDAQTPSTTVLKTCNTKDEIDQFIEIFKICFQEDAAESDIEKYADLVLLSHNYKGPFEVKNFLIQGRGDQNFGCITLITDEKGNAKIYNVGVLPQFRRQGIGASSVLQAASIWSQNLEKGHLSLQTSEGSFAEKMYQELGFKKVCTQEIWVKI